MSIEEQVINVVADQLAVDKVKINRATSFVNDLGADSLDTVELIMELEEEFDLMIPESEAEKSKQSVKLSTLSNLTIPNSSINLVTMTRRIVVTGLGVCYTVESKCR